MGWKEKRNKQTKIKIKCISKNCCLKDVAVEATNVSSCIHQVQDIYIKRVYIKNNTTQKIGSMRRFLAIRSRSVVVGRRRHKNSFTSKVSKSPE